MTDTTEAAPRPRNPGAIASSSAVVWLVVATAVCWFFGLGGYRFGPLIVIPLLLLPPALLLGRSQVESKALLLFTLMVAVFGLYTFVDNNSPPSKGALNAKLDEFDLPFFEEVERSTSGSSTCRPKCPEAERTWLAPSAAPQTAMAAAAGALADTGYIDDAATLFPDGQVPERMTLRRGNERIVVEAERRRRRGESTQVFLTIRIVGSR